MNEETTSKEKLARALEEIGDPTLAPMIRLARDGYYADFESPLTFPIITLVADLSGLGLKELAQRAMNGEFDGTRQESDAWASSDEGQRMMGMLKRRPKPSS